MLNSVCIQGRFTATPEERKTNSGKTVTAFTLASDRGKGETDFIPCVAWEKTAEHICRYFVKGKMAIVSGRLTSRRYEKDGEKRTAYEVVVQSIDFCGGKEEAKPMQEFAEVKEVDDGELPF